MLMLSLFCVNNCCRYEQGLEDYEEAVARVDKIKDDQQRQHQQQQQQAYGLGGLETALTLIETVSNVWNKVSNEFEQKQSTIANKSYDRPTANDFDGNDQSGKSRCRKFSQRKKKVALKKGGARRDWTVRECTEQSDKHQSFLIAQDASPFR